MKIYLSLLLFLAAFSTTAQNVGIGTTEPSENLEVKNPLRSTVKITSGGPMDTSRLIFSNRNEFIGTNMALTFLNERALFVSSSSLFPYLDSDSILYMTPFGMVGINNANPQQRLDVNGNVRSNGVLVNQDNFLELGYGLTKQDDNGKIGMNLFGETNTLSIVGGGVAADGSDRRMKFRADDVATFTGKGHFAGNVGIGTSPGPSALTLNSSGGSLLSLRNSNALNMGISSSIFFGGSNYTTGAIQTIGNTASNARMAFSTGYSFTGGPLILSERFTIANNGNVGVKNTSPEATLDVGGSIRFSGASPAAFSMTLTGLMMYNSPTGVIDSINGDYVRINHPMSNNDPDAMIFVTPVNNARSMRVKYEPSNGFWFLSHEFPYRVTGLQAVSYYTCSHSCINSPGDKWVFGDQSFLNIGFDRWNIMIIKK